MKTFYVTTDKSGFRHEVQADSPEGAALKVAQNCSRHRVTVLMVHDEGMVYPFSVELKWVAESLLPAGVGGKV